VTTGGTHENRAGQVPEAGSWDSEFLQMAVFVLLTTFLIQKGSPMVAGIETCPCAA
jgi:hypothetical protein